MHSPVELLPVELWTIIFGMASHTPYTNEFSTKSGSHNQLVWHNHGQGEGRGSARLSSLELAEALKIRRTIVLVCKTWHRVGLEILFSHMRVTHIQLQDPLFKAILEAFRPKLRHTKRLTIQLEELGTYEMLERATWLCASLPNLQILEAPTDFFSLCTLRFPLAKLEVAIFQNVWKFFPRGTHSEPRPLSVAWLNLRVMDITIQDLETCIFHYAHRFEDPIIFTALEDLCVSGIGGPVQAAVSYVGKWTAPKLKILTVMDFHEGPWVTFLRRHAQSLTTLTMFTNGCEPRWHPLWTPEDEGPFELPNLRALYYDWKNRFPDCLIIKGLQRVGIFDLGYKNIEEEPYESIVSTLREAMAYWSERYPNIISCCIAGCATTIKWLEKQPEVGNFAKEMKEKKVNVEFRGLLDGRGV